MRTRVQRWGNSLAVRIPKTFAEEVGLRNDSPVDLRLSQGRLRGGGSIELLYGGGAGRKRVCFA